MKKRPYPLDQNPHQTVIRFGCVGFSMYACGFSVAQVRQLCLFRYPPRSKWASFEKMIFFLPKSASSVSRSQAHLAKWCLSVYTTIFVRRKDKTNYLPNQPWAKCSYSRNKQHSMADHMMISLLILSSGRLVGFSGLPRWIILDGIKKPHSFKFENRNDFLRSPLRRGLTTLNLPK